MRKFMTALSAALLILSLSVVPALAQGLPQFADLAEKAGPAVVNISTVTTVANPHGDFDFHYDNRGPRTPLDEFFEQFDEFFESDPGPRTQQSLGSGFIISQDGYIVTNNHVIENADEVKVNLQDHNKASESYDAVVVGRDEETDLALLKIEAKQKLPTLSFGDSTDLRVGDWVLAIGNPFGLEHTVTAGIISAKGRMIGSGPFDDYLQTDASINPGNSGGPLLNLKGEVIGINTAIVAAGQGIGFAIPSRMAQRIIEELKTNKTVSRGWIGVTIQDVSQDAAKALGLPKASGALVASVLAGQPADKAGMQTGDVILRVNEEAIEDANDLVRTIAGMDPGTTVSVEVWRGGKKLSLSMTLGQRDTSMLSERFDTPAPPKSGSTVLGLDLRPLTGEEARALGLDKATGLLILAVTDVQRYADIDLRAGDVILKVNQQEVAGVQAFQDIVEQERSKGMLMLLVSRNGQNLFYTVPLN